MISDINEYLRLCESDCQEDNRRIVLEELSEEVIVHILKYYPCKYSWLIHNKSVPIKVLEELVEKENEDIRFTIAMKKKCNRYIFERLICDKSDSIRFAVVRNNKLPRDLLIKMTEDSNVEIAKEAQSRLNHKVTKNVIRR